MKVKEEDPGKAPFVDKKVRAGRTRGPGGRGPEGQMFLGGRGRWREALNPPPLAELEN